MRPFAILPACASLAACGGEPADPQADRIGETPNAEAPAAEPGNAALPSAEGDNSSSGAREPEPVPTAYRGTWAESEAECGDLSHPSRLVISGRTLRFHESEFEVARVEISGPREINIIGTATGEGTTRPAEYHVSLDASGETLTDEAGGGMVRRRCAG